MKRVVEAFHIAKGSEKAVGLVQIVLVLAVVIVTVAVTKLIRVAGDNGPGFSAERAGLVVDVYLPEAETHMPVVAITGEVTARATVIISPQVGGRIIKVHGRLEPGSPVDAGDILFEIDPRDYELALEKAEADVAAAESDLLQTQANAENFVKDWYRVFPDKPAPALVAKEPQIQALEARLKAAKAGAAQARLNLDRTRFHLEYPARIITSAVERGQLVTAGGNYGSLYASDSLRVTAGIDPGESARLGLKVGDMVRVSGELGPALAFDARVTQLGGVLDSRTRLQDVIIALPPGQALVPGTFVTVTLSGTQVDGIYSLPLSALATTGTVWRVKAGKLEEVRVDIVDMDGDNVYVRRFDVADGVVISEVPTSFIARPVSIRNRLKAEDAPGVGDAP